jgi:hypothetical protein
MPEKQRSRMRIFLNVKMNHDTLKSEREVEDYEISQYNYNISKLSFQSLILDPELEGREIYP